jgi:hypothetical protein
MYLWFIQTVLIASLIGVNPFNQPDVKLSKDTTNEILKNKMNYNLKDYYLKLEDFDSIKNKIFDFIKQNINKDITYISIQFYGDYEEVDNLEELREELIKEFRISVILSLGPRYLHSIGQLYKGGPKKGLFIQILNYPQKQLSLQINDLFVYQALGDLITTKKLNLPILGILI